MLFDELADAAVDDRQAQLQRDAGMSHAAYVVLAMLSESPTRSRRMSDLARRANQSQSRLSHTVARLEERGWVRRERAADDGSGNLAVLTDRGWDVVVAVAPGHVDAVREAVFGPLTTEQTRALGDALEAIADQAILRGTGARGLRAIMEEVLLPVMYDIPSRDDVAKVVVTKETVQDNVLPTIVPRKPSRAERRDKSA